MVMIEGEEDSPPDGPQNMEVYRFMTALWANHSDQRQLVRDVHKWWLGVAGVEPALELLTSESSLMSDETAKNASSLEPGAWRIGGFVCVLRSSASAHAAAREFLRDTFMKAH